MAKTYPKPIEARPELNLRHAIKSSISDIRQLIALTIALYLSKPTSELEYSQSQGIEINIKKEIKEELLTYFAEQVDMLDEQKSSFLLEVNENPLFKAQMEPLQVALELFLRLCKVSFTDGGPGSRERTGGVRHEKTLHFTTNLEIIRLAFQESAETEDQLKWVLFDWIISPEPQQESPISLRLKQLLTIFSEETQFRLRTEQEEAVYFQQEGIYKALLETNAVYGQDSQENVGPFRILKSFVGSSLHSFLKGDNKSVVSNKQFMLRPEKDKEELRHYAGLVSNYLDIIPKRTTIVIAETSDFQATDLPSSPLPTIPHNRIFFGSPGSGKSHRIDQEFAQNYPTFRTIFHPDTDYASFVGAYKPTMSAGQDETQQSRIVYSFQAQTFAEAYWRAWQSTAPVFLVIEEINRGNCAQIFGDLFQSLDRNERGYSKYPIDADADFGRWLINRFLADEQAKTRFSEVAQTYNGLAVNAFSKLILPNNLYLYATMNTSDQSLFPMDSAFKRRWDWEYVPIDYADAARFTIHLSDALHYNWGTFIRVVNQYIVELTGSEDKQLGNRFVNPHDGIITLEAFKSKVMFYLWSEIYRHEMPTEPKNIFQYQPTGKPTKQPFTFNQLFEKTADGEPLDALILASFMNELSVPPSEMPVV